MEKDQIHLRRYTLSLEKTIQSHYHFLKEALEEFQQKCLRVSPGRNVPPDIINQIRESYKTIRIRLIEIRSIQQLLQSKYRQFYRRDPVRDKDITEFEFTLKEIKAKKKMEKERLARMPHKKEPSRGSF